MMEEEEVKSALRQRADEIREFRCKNLIAVIENPKNIKNIGTVIRNVNALGIEKTYVVDGAGVLADDWEEIRTTRSISKSSASAVKWSFVKRFDNTNACLEHLEKNNFVSLVTSPHMKGKKNSYLDETDFTVYKKLAIWFGNETIGISDVAVENSELCINIPMYGIIESLNLGTTTGIVLYEVAKQRRAYVNDKNS